MTDKYSELAIKQTAEGLIAGEPERVVEWVWENSARAPDGGCLNCEFYHTWEENHGIPGPGETMAECDVLNQIAHDAEDCPHFEWAALDLARRIQEDGP